MGMEIEYCDKRLIVTAAEGESAGRLTQDMSGNLLGRNFIKSLSDPGSFLLRGVLK